MADSSGINLGQLKSSMQIAKDYIDSLKLDTENKINQANNNHVTKEIGNANQITFADGQTFQAKLDAGTLKGETGETGAKHQISL